MKYKFQCDGMLTIECQTPIKQTLTKSQASELTELIAKDLHAVLKINNNTALVFCGAAFSTEQLLQPKFPIQVNMTQYASAAFQGELNSDQVLSIGANDGFMPDGLRPNESQQNLLHLPFCLYTDDVNLAEQFEATLMHKGMVAPPTYAKICEQTQVVINHANYMTYLDLVAMMHNHYEQLGLSHLWQVIETALVSSDPKTAVTTHTHNHFYLVDHLLFTPYFSYAQFTAYFADTSIEDYINWLMAQRLSLGAFTAHGLAIKTFKADLWPISEEKVCLGQFEKQSISQSFWTEKSHQSSNQPKQVIYHQHPQAGVIAISVAQSELFEIHYPVTPHGIRDIEKHLSQQLGPGFESIESDVTSNPNGLL
ncbi:hypothetical protein [Marinicella litoralis]|uniref:Uncharacterized protein n=1 Tax=Marinicella litoralis TaxID=644220 RepID=A0A4R6XT97_9GAMM|nr:hypothetical protein [Marinicella litoralis]TDR23175.1 hypothetical protein C8D91_0034 [Marinicella litoralis]